MTTIKATLHCPDNGHITKLGKTPEDCRIPGHTGATVITLERRYWPDGSSRLQEPEKTPGAPQFPTLPEMEFRE